MVVADYHSDDMRRNQTDKTDEAYIGNHHGTGQAAQYHAHKGQPFHMDAKADGGFFTAKQGILIPAVGIAIDTQNYHNYGHATKVFPAGAT